MATHPILVHSDARPLADDAQMGRHAQDLGALMAQLYQEKRIPHPTRRSGQCFFAVWNENGATKAHTQIASLAMPAAQQGASAHRVLQEKTRHSAAIAALRAARDLVAAEMAQLCTMLSAAPGGRSLQDALMVRLCVSRNYIQWNVAARPAGEMSGLIHTPIPLADPSAMRRVCAALLAGPIPSHGTLWKIQWMGHRLHSKNVVAPTFEDACIKGALMGSFEALGSEGSVQAARLFSR